MKKKILCSILVLTIFTIVGCNNEKNALNDVDEKVNDKIETSFEDNLEEKEKIVKYISAECSWAYDVTNPEEVLQNTDYLVRVKVKTKEKTKYFIKNALMPSSTYNMEILDVISPEESSLPKNIKLVVAGGVISMEEYVNSLDFETKEKLKTDELSEKELKQLIMISNESYYELEQGNEYIICIRDLTQDKDYKGYYGMPEGGYDVFQEKDGAYVNVLTQKKLVR